MLDKVFNKLQCSPSVISLLLSLWPIKKKIKVNHLSYTQDEHLNIWRLSIHSQNYWCYLYSLLWIGVVAELSRILVRSGACLRNRVQREQTGRDLHWRLWELLWFSFTVWWQLFWLVDVSVRQELDYYLQNVTFALTGDLKDTILFICSV